MDDGQMSAALADQASRKAFRRLIWFLLILYVIAYLDRINIGFAALSMNRELGLTAAAFGLANTIFYLGYFFCEIPSNALMVRYGPRRWIARILITWGLASIATCLAMGPASLYFIRFVVGIFEAGFVPGVLLYLTYWFPASQRGRATSVFMIAQPIAIGFGALISGLIMSNTGGLFGLSGWQWLFIIEGLPAVLLGIAVLFYLPDRPATASWLSSQQAAALEMRVSAEAPKIDESLPSWRHLLTGSFFKISLAYFCLVTSLNALATWSPLIVREVLGGTNDVLRVGLITAVPGIVTIVAMPIWGMLSDRAGERIWFYVGAIAVAATGWLLVVTASIPAVRLSGLVLATVGGFSGMAILWTVPPLILSAKSRPLGTATLSCAGIAGSVTSPAIIGFLRDNTGSFNAGIWYTIGVLVVSMVAFATLARIAVRPSVTLQAGRA